MLQPFLLDFTIHHFDLMRCLTGEEATRVVGHSFRPPWTWVDGRAAAAAILTLRGGAGADFGGIMGSRGLEMPQEGLITAIGEKGTLHVDDHSQVRLCTQGDHRPVPQEPTPGDELGNVLAEFLAAVRERRQPGTHVAEHLRALALVLAVAESSRRQAWVEVAEIQACLL